MSLESPPKLPGPRQKSNSTLWFDRWSIIILIVVIVVIILILILILIIIIQKIQPNQVTYPVITPATLPRHPQIRSSTASTHHSSLINNPNVDTEIQRPRDAEAKADLSLSPPLRPPRPPRYPRVSLSHNPSDPQSALLFPFPPFPGSSRFPARLRTVPALVLSTQWQWQCTTANGLYPLIGTKKNSIRTRSP